MKDQPQAWKYEKTISDAPAGYEDRSSALIVQVAAGSPADQLGIRVDDRIISIDGSDFRIQPELDETARNTTFTYKFYLKESHAFLDVKIDPLPLGIVAEPSSENIIKELKSNGFSDWHVFHILWKRMDWKRLMEAAEAVYSNNGMVKLIRKMKKNFGYNPGMLYLGAALFEMDRREEGIDIIVDFMNNVMSYCGTSEHAVAYFYYSKWTRLNGNKEESLKWLLESDRSNAGYFERISQEVYLKNIEPAPDRYRWAGREFPLFYTLGKLYDETKQISLSRSLEEMSENQLILVCVMPGYRDNGPYNDAMGCYRSLFRYISDKVMPMHIVLDTLESAAGNEWRRENENLARENDIPFVLLHDPDCTVSAALEIEFSPVFYFINKKGVVVYDGNLQTGYDYWSVLGS